VNAALGSDVQREKECSKESETKQEY
jgi:hypothetical protein